ncbi:MAG: type II toxin-antitoxin system RelE/ParE family toxin [Candidatus Andersenbacteria bacterium CG10_big_fil_rev_8_21_14_0_10_54_11]|uniref:Type II toxin-antitoxin system RelE/ParE family toxin n=1 Tax=Candidatus Andersenbacteria bacterium CG10_big_fil_rev_8_21_14_0_10_54_11 TaxID=1974485 RepID=A0A2M6WZB9_9BACT|nr:MAG: type II toxin-antitoxin system RelE/ParE family toxin [Candidatus Andersenbacteria bacterium CG10_big_fil_rev_8_21_14_0_10_54_11]
MSKGTFSYRPQARIDISESAEYIAQDSPDVAVAFVRAVADTCRALAEMPEMGVQRDYENPALLEARMMPVRGYHKYLIFYIPHHHNHIDVLRVLHGSRDLPTLLGT